MVTEVRTCVTKLQVSSFNLLAETRAVTVCMGAAKVQLPGPLWLFVSFMPAKSVNNVVGRKRNVVSLAYTACHVFT
jgi:hypothetical protein